MSPTASRAVGGRTTRRIGKAGKPGRASWSSPSRVRRTCRADRMPAEARRGLSVGEVIPRVAHEVGEGVSLDVPVRIARTGKQLGDLTPRPPGMRHKRQQPGDRTTRISDHELFTRSSPANEISRSRAHITKFDGLHEAVLARDVILSQTTNSVAACSGGQSLKAGRRSPLTLLAIGRDDRPISPPLLKHMYVALEIAAPRNVRSSPDTRCNLPHISFLTILSASNVVAKFQQFISWNVGRFPIFVQHIRRLPANWVFPCLSTTGSYDSPRRPPKVLSMFTETIVFTAYSGRSGM